MFPKLAVVEPALMMSVPPKFTAYQGMDAFFHASESRSLRDLNEFAIGKLAVA